MSNDGGYLNTFFGRIFSRGAELELRSGVDFLGGLIARVNKATNRIEVLLADTLQADDYGASLGPVAGPPAMTGTRLRLRALAESILGDVVPKLVLDRTGWTGETVLTSPRKRTGGIITGEVSGSVIAPGNESGTAPWVTLLELPIRTWPKPVAFTGCLWSSDTGDPPIFLVGQSSGGVLVAITRPGETTIAVSNGSVQFVVPGSGENIHVQVKGFDEDGSDYTWHGTITYHLPPVSLV